MAYVAIVLSDRGIEMQAAQLALLTDAPAAPAVDDTTPPDVRRATAALVAAERLASRVGATLPEAVRRALTGAAARSAIEGIAAHVVRTVDALHALGGPAPVDPTARQALVDRLHAELPPTHGASPGIARAIIAAVVAPDAEPAAPAADT